MTANDIRNICLLGHGGSGKTTLAEQMLFMTKGTDRLGRTADGNTVCDYDAEEIKRQISISLAFAPVKYKDVRINVMDAPGNFDFSGEAISAIRAAECAVLVGAAKDGLSVGMERSWKLLGKKPRMIFVNRTDEDNSDYQACLDALKGKFGQSGKSISASSASRSTEAGPSGISVCRRGTCCNYTSTTSSSTSPERITCSSPCSAPAWISSTRTRI